MVKHWPVLASDVYDDFAELISDEEGQQGMLGQQQLWQAAPKLCFILTGYADPHFVDQVLQMNSVSIRHGNASAFKSYGCCTLLKTYNVCDWVLGCGAVCVYTHFKHCKTIHHDIFVSAVGEEVEAVSPGARLASKTIQQFLYKERHKHLNH